MFLISGAVHAHAPPSCAETCLWALGNRFLTWGAPAVGYSGAGFFMAGFIVLWRVLGMKAGHSKSMRILGIVGILEILKILGILKIQRLLRILRILRIPRSLGFLKF